MDFLIWDEETLGICVIVQVSSVGDEELGSVIGSSKGIHSAVARVFVVEVERSRMKGSSEMLGKGIESKGTDEDKVLELKGSRY